MSLRSIKTIKSRREFISRFAGKGLNAIGVYPQELENAQYKNCENMIGASSIPLGIAGPLKIKGSFAKGDFYIPLVTTEGALIASVNRGCKAVYSEGVCVRTELAGITRGIIFKTKGIEDSFRVKSFILENLKKIEDITSQKSSHLKLIDISFKIVGRNLYVRIAFDSMDAMGMNMATFASEDIASFIKKNTKAELLSLAGNFDLDKKPSWLNFIKGRGREVWAEAEVGRRDVKEILKTTPEKIVEVFKDKCLIGSAISGSLGFNAQFANIIAAIFIACGQDVAHTVEGSLGITTTEVKEDSLYISIYLPDLIIGTVGGGTYLPTQKEALEIMGVAGGNSGKNANKFAEIIGGAVLVGELSLLASLAEGSLAQAHKSLGRREKKA